MTAPTLKRPPRREELTALREEHRQRAAAVELDVRTLRRWRRKQVRYEVGRVRDYHGYLELATRLLKGADDPNWARYHQGDALYRFHVDTLRLVWRSGHVMSCENHGVGGVSEDDWRAAGVEPGPEAYDGLSLRGTLEGEGSTAWLRMCVECAKKLGLIERVEKQLARGISE
jgi:hypothetical protein